MQLKLEVIKREQIEVSVEPGIPITDYISLYRASGDIIFGRGVPENIIFKAKLVKNVLSKVEVLISPDYNTTHDPDIGYQDPTVVPGTNNLLLSKTYFVKDKLYCEISFAEKHSDGMYRLTTALDPKYIQDLSPYSDMVKEVEFIDFLAGINTVVYEYTNGPSGMVGQGVSSCIAIGDYVNEKVINSKPFLSAEDDDSQHVSTCGSPVKLENGNWLLFYNRCRSNKWGIAWLVMSPQYEILSRSEHFVIEPERSYEDKLSIAFGSCVTVIDEHIEILYHIDDRIPARALILLTQ